MLVCNIFKQPIRLEKLAELESRLLAALRSLLQLESLLPLYKVCCLLGRG